MKDLNTSLDDITDLVNTDSSLTVQILRLSNSAMYASGISIDTLDEAINRVGFSELFKLVGMASTAQVFSERNELYDLDGALLWENSLACALSMEYLAKITGMDPQEAYTIGLLRSMGKMILDTCVKGDPEVNSYALTNELLLEEWEDANFGITNPTVAGFILISWNFPDVTSQAIQYQYAPEEDSDSIRYSHLLHLSCLIADKMGKGLPCENRYWEATDERLEIFGILPGQIEEAAVNVEEALNSLVSSVAS